MSGSRIALVAALITLLTACSTQRPRAESCEAQALSMNACIQVEALAEWESVDDRTLLLWAPGATRAYLVRLTKAIENLSSLDEVEIADGDQDRLICGCGRDGVFDAVSGRSARIGWVEFLTEQRTAELLGTPSTIL